AVALRDLINAHRTHGHLAARIDPFGRAREGHSSLDPAAHGLAGAASELFDAGPLSPNAARMPLSDILAALRSTYCASIGSEFMHITNDEERAWLIDRLESSRGRPTLAREERQHILTQLHRAELFEHFCGIRFRGVKRFSLEGGDSTIPLLDRFLESAGDAGVKELVMGMAHRGRLNVLTNIVGKTYAEIFTEFEDAWTEDSANGGGDVKYHRGYSSNRILRSGKSLWVSMASNPSHLESQNAVVLGRCRAKQRTIKDYERVRVVPIILHGDASVIGQGVVAENFNLSQLEGYFVGGALHVVINNLIGFTTGEDDARSSRYCTDIAKMLEIPIFHVNGEDPEAVVHVARIAFDYRMRFKKDVVIDLLCYRRHGHNETDEAMFTQPLLYKEIKDKPSVLKTYAERLLAENVITEAEMKDIRRSLDDSLEKAYHSAKAIPVDPTPEPGRDRWKGITEHFSFDPVETGVAREQLAKVAAAIGRWPETFTPHHKIIPILQNRARCVEDDLPIDWGTAENLAVGTIILDGNVVRLTGQDSRRGTFSHRHAALRDVNTGDLFVPLSHIDEELNDKVIKRFGDRGPEARRLEGKYWVYDSPLSEYAIMGYEYGYSLASPNLLVMWEAQFGDFANTAQTVIDQYIASAEVKWNRWSGLVLLLPHGYEGQGPEHSNARPERFLQLCADHNMQVCIPTTSAQYFHLLRRQVNPQRTFRKPLIIMTPKSLLRADIAKSRVDELTRGTFQEILDDPTFAPGGRAAKKEVRRVILCSGKVYYDLVARREELNRKDLAIVRVEQLYPLHTQLLHEIIATYPKEVELVWVQEEPKNMGAYTFMQLNLSETFGWELSCISRPPSATPATGSPKKHAEQLNEFLTDAVGASSKPVVVAH
ncbi:MAG: 2-oxoglutarate dehydrogenase E1 component, partial [Phycisphaerae bacterium]|nr:2-oxoglutarate dehydrogenase E1 component [Phycisphaerae bacterium]